MKSEKTTYQLLIIEKIKNLREEKNISQAQICEIIGLGSVGQVGNIESPKFKHKYTLKQLNMLADYFKIPLSNLFLNNQELLQSTDEVLQLLIDKIIDYEQ